MMCWRTGWAWAGVLSLMVGGAARADAPAVWPIGADDPLQSYLGADLSDDAALPAGIDAVLDRGAGKAVVRIGQIEGLEPGTCHVVDTTGGQAWHIAAVHSLASAKLSPDASRLAAVLTSPYAYSVIVYTIDDGAVQWLRDVQATAGSVNWVDATQISYVPWSADGKSGGSAVVVDLDKLAGGPIYAPEVYSCGGTNDDYNCGGSNPYPCCSNGGNCTWWAWDRACRNWNRAIPVFSCCGGSGDAWQWLQGAIDRSYPTSSTPAVNTIAVDSNKSLSSLGHVCWVLEVTSTQVRVSEQNCGGGYGSQERWYNRSSFEGYIYNIGGGSDPCAGSDGAAFVSESWPYDNDVVNPGQSFTKSWTMRNSGASTWKKSCNHKWAFDGGDQFGAASYTDLGDSENIAPGQNKTWSLNMTAPTTPGTYQGWWKMDRYGTGRFGDRVWVKIQVGYPATQITSHPGGQSPCPGSNATFSVSASGHNLSYRWQFNNNNIYDGGKYAGTGGSTLTVSNCDGSVAGSYRCVVSGSNGSATSNSASLTILPVTSITGHPTSRTECPGATATFSVSASGQSLSYRWQRNSSDISDGNGYSGTGGATLTISGVNSGHAGQYRCRVSGTCASPNSNEATLTVRPATTVTQQPASVRVCNGGNATLSCAGTGEGSVSYRWHKGGVALDDGGKIAGSGTGTLQVNGVDAGDTGNYTCVLSAGCGTTTTGTATLTVVDITAVTQDPTGQTLCEGQTANFQISAAGEGKSYQWRLNGSNLINANGISGATGPSLSIAPALPAHSGNYDCVVTGECGTDTTAAAGLLVNEATVIHDHPQPQTGCQYEYVSFAVNATGTNLTFRWQKDGIDLYDDNRIIGADTPVLGINACDHPDAGQYRCVVAGDCGTATSDAAALSVTSTVVITRDPLDTAVCVGRTARLIMAGSGVDVTYQWYRDSQPLSDGGNLWGCNSPVLTIQNAGEADLGMYTCTATGLCGQASTSAAELTLTTPPCPGGTMGYWLEAVDINAGGEMFTSSNYTGWASTGQAGGVGEIASASYGFYDGFWHVVFGPTFVVIVPPDFDEDGDVDLADVAHLENCVTGPLVGPVDPPCVNADLDEDGDIDQVDFGLTQTCFSGENVPSDPNCFLLP